MNIYQLISLCSLLICTAALLYHLAVLIKLGLQKDYSKKAGNIKSAIAYSYTGAMNPMQKESAYLHFPTYTAGMLYHIGTFTAAAVYVLQIFSIQAGSLFQIIFICIFSVSVISGLGIFIKRISFKKLRYLSNPDDYISNILVTVFQILSLLIFVDERFSSYYYICSAILFLYLPLGKLKHLLYFFAARYHLGFFYGWRGIWPIKNHKQA